MNNPLMQLITSAANEPNLLQQNEQLAQQNIQLVVTVNLMTKMLSEYETWGTIKDIKHKYVEKAQEILQEIQTTSKTTEEAEAKLSEYLEQFN